MMITVHWLSPPIEPLPYYYYDEYTYSAVGPLTARTLADTHDAAYGTAMTARGNLTSVRNLRDPYNYSSFVNNYLSYDVLGNVVAESVNCCRRKVISYDYSAAQPDYYKYAYPVSVTRGDAGQLTTGATYDLFGQMIAEYGGTTTQATSGVRYVMLDHQGSARVVMNESGTVVARHGLRRVD